MRGELVPLHEILGVSTEDVEKASRKFAQILSESDDIREVCRQVVAECGVESVCMVMCLNAALEVMTCEPGVSGIERPMVEREMMERKMMAQRKNN